ncbi:DoxX family membrane protein, partial [Nocardia mangyaensis]
MNKAPQSVRELLLLFARVAKGVVILAHGWQKLFTNAMNKTTGKFTQLG